MGLWAGAGRRGYAICLSDSPPTRAPCWANVATMLAIVGAFLAAFRPRASLVAENLLLRQQLAILCRATPRPRLRPIDRAFWVTASELWSRCASRARCRAAKRRQSRRTFQSRRHPPPIHKGSMIAAAAFFATTGKAVALYARLRPGECDILRGPRREKCTAMTRSRSCSAPGTPVSDNAALYPRSGEHPGGLRGGVPPASAAGPLGQVLAKWRKRTSNYWK
jgi:hypothetical protein